MDWIGVDWNGMERNGEEWNGMEANNMNTKIVSLLVQMGYYAVVFIGTLLVIGVLERGFFWKYLKVRMSMGRLILVKVRELTHDWYSIGMVKESMIEYKYFKDKKTIALPKDKPVFYRTLAVTMIDIDAETNNICSVNYEAVPGFDAIKHKDLHTRALMKPNIKKTHEIVVIILLVLAVVGILIMFTMIYRLTKDTAVIKSMLAAIKIPPTQAIL